MSGKLIIIDANFIAHKCRFAGDMLRCGKDGGVLHSLLECALDFHECYSGSRIAFAFDSVYSWRRKEFPWYKSARRDRNVNMNPDELELLHCMYRQLSTCPMLLKRCGFSNAVLRNGFEGDDIIAAWTKEYDGRVVIVSADKDLYQLLGPDVCMATPRGGRIGRPYTHMDFFAEYGIYPCQWATYKAVNGCPGDGVPNAGKDPDTGVIRFKVGHKTTLKYLADELPSAHPFRARMETREARLAVVRNLRLVTLPFPKLKCVELADDCFSERSFKDVFARFAFSDFLVDRWDEWKHFLTKDENKKSR